MNDQSDRQTKAPMHGDRKALAPGDARQSPVPAPVVDAAVHAALDDASHPAAAGPRASRQLAALGAMQTWLRATRPAAPPDLATAVSRRLAAETTRSAPLSADARGAAPAPAAGDARPAAGIRDGRATAGWPTWLAWLSTVLDWQPARAPALTLAAVLVLVLAVHVGQLGRDGPGAPAAPRATVAGTAVDGTLVAHRFVLDAPDAEQVCLVGNFNGWSVCDTPLERTADGSWSTTVRLPEGRYEYMFVVDSEWRSDPRAALVIDDGFGNENAVLLL